MKKGSPKDEKPLPQHTHAHALGFSGMQGSYRNLARAQQLGCAKGSEELLPFFYNVFKGFQGLSGLSRLKRTGAHRVRVEGAQGAQAPYIL